MSRKQNGRKRKRSVSVERTKAASTSLAPKNNDIHNSRLQQAITAQLSKDFEKAESLYQQLLNNKPDDAAVLANLGMLRRQQGRPEDALDCYQRALNHGDGSPELYFNLGNLHLSMNKFEDAKAAYEQLLQRQPNHFNGLMQLARAASGQGALGEAIATYRQLLNLSPGHHDALLEMGNCLRSKLQREQSLQTYELLLESHPQSWKGHYALGRLLCELERSEEGDRHLQQAIAAAPKPLSVMQTLADAHLADGRLDAAMVLYRKIVQQQPSNGNARIGLATCLKRQGGSEPEVYQHLQEVSKSDDVALLCRLADVSINFNFWRESLDILKKVVALTDNNIEARFNLADASTTAYQLTDALELIRGCIADRPEQPEYFQKLATIQLKYGDVEAALATYKETARLQGTSFGASLNFARLYSDTIPIEEHAQQHSQFARDLTTKVGTQGVPKQHKRAHNDNKLRIGYVSGDLFHQHPVDIFLQPILQHHDREQFSIYLYYNGSGYDDRTRLARSQVDNWRETAQWVDERLLQQIEQDQIDILVDLSGHTNRNRMPLFAKRAAPVQMSMIGYPFTSGLASMDYLLADAVTVPLAEETLYSEKILRLSRFIFCYPDNLHPQNEPRAERNEVIFGSFNNVPKLTPRTIRLWAEILCETPASRMLLKSPSFQDLGVCDRYRQQFIDFGVESSRIEFRGPSALDLMMHEYRDIDIALDPMPFCGGTTSMQALWAATPLITRQGKGFFQRMGAGLLSQLKEPQWIAESDQDYVTKAVALASDRDKLRLIQRQLPERLAQSGLTDTQAYTRNLEELYRQIAC